jgi:hypothetical protein
LEHCLRGGISALVAAYAAGQIVWDGTVNIQDLTAWFLIFVGGFVTSLLLSMGIHLSTSTGPALNKAESFETKRSARKQAQDGIAELVVIEICAIIVAVVALLWLFGVHPGR